jgi:hypothetical protein
VFDDDGRVAYAYLLKQDEIVSDVWLYNHCSAPKVPEWSDRSKAPFANPEEFAKNDRFRPVRAADDVALVWVRNKRELAAVEVWVRGELHARLVSGVKPGWCRLALKDGPLAKVLAARG